MDKHTGPLASPNQDNIHTFIWDNHHHNLDGTQVQKVAMPQCAGITGKGKGERCTRDAKDGGSFCWQHEGKQVEAPRAAAAPPPRAAAAPAGVQAVAQKPQCAGFTRDGPRCTKAPQQGSSFCHFHKDQAAPAGGAAAAAPPPAGVTTAAAQKAQCAGKTQEGSRCTRPAKDGGSFCWQHEGKQAEAGRTAAAVAAPPRVAAAPAAAAAAAQRPQCAAVSAEGVRCKRTACEGSRFCHIHKCQETQAPCAADAAASASGFSHALDEPQAHDCHSDAPLGATTSSFSSSLRSNDAEMERCAPADPAAAPLCRAVLEGGAGCPEAAGKSGYCLSNAWCKQAAALDRQQQLLEAGLDFAPELRWVLGTTPVHILNTFSCGQNVRVPVERSERHHPFRPLTHTATPFDRTTCTVDDREESKFWCEGATEVANVNGSAADSAGSWLGRWEALFQQTPGMTMCAAAGRLDAPTARQAAQNCANAATKGGHVWMYDADGRVDMRHCYIAPICDAHNAGRALSYPGHFALQPYTWLMRVAAHACYDDYEDEYGLATAAALSRLEARAPPPAAGGDDDEEHSGE